MKYTYIITFLLALNISVQADFFACRKLVHPQTKKTVYLLYDVHASVIANPSLEEKLLKDMISIVHVGVQENKQIRGFDNACRHREKLFRQIHSQMNLMRNNLPNLVKQHNDLLEIVKKYQVSLINEDWGDPEKEEMDIPFGAPEYKFHMHIGRCIGRQKNYGNNAYRECVSPIFGISKALVGTFAPLKFHPVGKAYFFNPDARNGWGGTEQDRGVDNEVLNAIDALFSQYHQNTVIVSTGYAHSIHVVDALMQKGYKAYDVIISTNLAAQRKKSAALDEFLKVVEENNSKKFYQLKSLSEELVYSLITKPLDLHQVFISELGVRAPRLESGTPNFIAYLHDKFRLVYDRLCKTVYFYGAKLHINFL